MYPSTPPEPAKHDPERFDVGRRLAFLELTSADAERLRALSPLFDQHARAFVDQFYQHLFRFPETTRFLQDAALVERLKAMQLAHLHSMLEAAWGEEYVARRRRVGSVHAEHGIEPEFFLGSYQLYLSFYLQRLEEQTSTDRHQFTQQVQSLVKAIVLDIGLTLDAYFSKLTDDLRQALDMYWRANAELRQFAQLASHDMKTPLATVANLCEEVLDEFRQQMPKEACDLIERAKQRTYKMSHMIDDLLAATLTQPGTDRLSAVPLGEVLADVIDRLQAAIAEKQVALTMPEQLPSVLGNRPRLCEALYNLLSNAVKFIDAQPATVTIGITETAQETVISIIDNGPGVPPEELERIFNPFRRMPQHRTLPGSGLGLYFTKSLVEQQGGRVWAESSVSGGGRFFVAFQRP